MTDHTASATFGSPSGQAVTVQASRASDLEWLHENLVPWFQPLSLTGRAPASRDCVIKVRVSPAEHARLRSRIDPAGTVSGWMAFHGHPDATRPLVGDRTAIWDGELQLFYRHQPDTPEIEVLAGREQDATRVALFRLIREVATHGLVAQAALPLHAAALTLDGAGVLVAGPRRSGKTSWLLHLLRNPSARFLSNDRAFAQAFPGGECRLTGLPTIIGIRPESRELAGAGRFDGALGWRARRTLSESQTLPAESNPEISGGKLALSPAQFLHCIDRPGIDTATVRLILFPRMDPAIEGVRMQPLEPDEVTRRLSDNLFPVAESPLALGTGKILPPLSQSTLDCLAQTPAREFRLGPRAIPSSDLLASLLRDLF